MTDSDGPGSDGPDATVVAAIQQRQAVLDDHDLTGRALCVRLSEATDELIVALFHSARSLQPRSPRVAILATGGYGRGELAPFSDLDVMLVHETTPKRVEPLASAMWYPLWDAGLRVGHAVRTFDEEEKLAKKDLDSATALLTARYIVGDHKLGAATTELGRSIWTRRRSKWLDELHERVRERQMASGEVAYTLEPDLKDGHGGLRDVQSLWWAEAGGLQVRADDLRTLDASYDVLLDTRVALHRATGRQGEVLRLEDQDAVAERTGHGDADALMADVAAAARRVMWVADESWGRLNRPTGRRRRTAPAPERVTPGVVLSDGEIELADGADPASDPTLVLQLAVAAARRRARIGRTTLDRLANDVRGWPETWPLGATDELVGLLLEGHAAIPVLEALDQRGLISTVLPEWEPVRSRPQRNAYHRYTVDRHLWETAANAAGLVERVARPDLLVLGALFHDLGKGYPGDHTEVGMELVEQIGPRLGLPERDVRMLVAMVEHHLLLPDVAMRRDLTDQATISMVADAVGTVEVLDLLHTLTEADSRATGPSAWNSWKEELVNDLAARVRHVLGGGDVSEVTWRLFPDEQTLATMAGGVADISVSDDRLTIVNPDRPGTFSRLAGVLALHGLDVLSAQAHSEEAHAGGPSMAASQFRVLVPRGGLDWGPIHRDLERALDGSLAIEARLAERARTYRRRRATQAQPPGPPHLEFHDRASSNATVIEVRAPNKVGVLYRVTKALAEVGLDIRHATVQTIGMEVVDSFYVRTFAGDLVAEPFHRDEIRRAVLHAIG